MPSKYWELDTADAYERPFELEVRRQFLREATALLNEFYPLLISERNWFDLEDRSKEKAVWLLHLESFECLIESLRALENGRHRVASSLFRTAAECLDLAMFFNSETPRSVSRLCRWFEDEVVPNREYREWVKKTVGEDAAQLTRERYESLSRMTHRSYQTILPIPMKSITRSD